MSGWDRVAESVEQIATALGVPGDRPRPARRDVESRLAAIGKWARPEEFAYLTLSVLGGTIPTPGEVIRFGRTSRVDDGAASARIARAAARRATGRAPLPRIDSRVVVDITDTASSPFTTGIQRVAREVVPRWARTTEVATVAWDRERHRLVETALDGAVASTRHVVPFGGSIVLPEVAVDSERAQRLASIARFSRSRSAAIGFDCIPVTTAEVAGPGMPGAFAGYLAMLASFDVVVPISEASALEYRGWRRMLAGAGITGPDIQPVDLAYDAGAAVPADDELVREHVGIDAQEEVVLVVGSHEPRKNHLRVLSAAEQLWADGREFALVMVGGNSWSTTGFDREVARLRARARRVVTVSRAPDEVVWGLYELATVSVFPSLNEGFGLPVVESLSHGTPVVTSDFGSTRELGRDRGALLVDPRSNRAIASAIEVVLADPGERSRLVAQTESLPARSWDDYAAESWDVIAGA